ncbi:MAG TPA: hypothetical protein VGN14_03615 [Candidatus Elarobacter sp.]
MRIEVKNSSPKKTLKAVKVEYANFDDFGKPAADEKYGDAPETFAMNMGDDGLAPGDSDESAVTFDDVPTELGKITCTPLIATFTDGSTWSSPEAASNSDSN